MMAVYPGYASRCLLAVFPVLASQAFPLVLPALARYQLGTRVLGETLFGVAVGVWREGCPDACVV